MDTSNKYLLPSKKIYKEKVQYQKDFPTMFDFGDMKRTEEAMVSSLLSLIGRKMKLQGGYKQNLIEISYAELANLAGGKLVRSYTDKKTGKTYRYIARGRDLNKLVEDIQKKAKSISYDVPKSLSDLSKGYDSYQLFVAYNVDHENQKLTVNLSKEIYQKEFIDENGILHDEKRIYELFYQENWGDVQHLYYNPAFHNALKSKYSMRLYRALATFRKSSFYRVRSDDFVESVMKLDTPSKKREKNKFIQKAFKELQEAKDQYDNPVFPSLELIQEKEGRKTVRYYFKFKPFSNDMLPLLGVDDQGRFIFDFGYKKISNDDKDASPEFLEVLNKFHDVFSTDGEVDNANNRNTLKRWLKSVDKEVVIEMLNRSGYKGKRTFGWTVRAMEEIIANGVKTLEDLKDLDDQNFKPNEFLTNQLIDEDSEFQEVVDLLKQLLKEEWIPPVILNDARNYNKKRGVSISLITTAIQETIFTGDKAKENWKYVKSILDSWIKKGIKTLEQYNAVKEYSEVQQGDVNISEDFLKAMDLWSEDN